jgi:hypothetical protein
MVQGYCTEEAMECALNYVDSSNSIGVSKSRHEGRLTGKWIIGKKAITSDPHIPGHPSWAKWAGLKHDGIGPARARPSMKDCGPCWPEAHTGPCPGLTSGSLCQAWHDPFGRARLGPMVGPICPARQT